jgi:N-acetylglucosaminyl-diphospho-decaprenol L-rhamnosyltransferase
MNERQSTETADVAVIVVSYNTRELLRLCLQKVCECPAPPRLEIWVVDNGSRDGSVEMLRSEFPTAHLIANTENLGFAGANNQALRAAGGRYALLLNSDAMLSSTALSEMWTLAETEPNAGVVGAQLLNPDGTFQASHSPFPTLWSEFLILSGLGRLLGGPRYPSHGAEREFGPQRVDYAEGACLLVRRSAVHHAGLLDEGYFMYAEEVDWCFRMRRAGWETWYQPAAEVVHYGGASSAGRATRREGDLYRSRVRFFRIHHGSVAAGILKAMIVASTAVKLVLHGALRRLSRGGRGRPVISIGDLLAALREV